jgi:hypothetical protein
MGGCGLDSSGLGQRWEEDSCEHCDEHSGSKLGKND